MSTALRSTVLSIPCDAGTIKGDLVVPADAVGLVIFAHGSGSGRHSVRNRTVAATLRSWHLATLLLDLLTPDEERRDIESRAFRFDIPLLADRLVAAIDLIRHDPSLQLPIALFGASTGAAAALVAAARRPDVVRAVVSRGGRPDLAGTDLAAVRAPTLLIVGSHDPQVLALNRESARHMRAHNRLEIVPGATHLFEEPGALDAVAESAARWCVARLLPVSSDASAATGRPLAVHDLHTPVT